MHATLKERKRKMNILKLKGKMVEMGVSAENLATEINVDRSTLYRKLKSGESFTVGEVQKIIAVLDLTRDETHDIFFS
jgi:predicted transcriptional regulator